MCEITITVFLTVRIAIHLPTTTDFCIVCSTWRSVRVDLICSRLEHVCV